MCDKVENIVELQGVCYSYPMGKSSLPVLNGVDFSFQKGLWHCIYGASGSGKTTLLNMIGALERPDSGNVVIGGRCINRLSRSQAAYYRAGNIGFVFQSYHLLPELTVMENILLPARFGQISMSKARKRAAELLERVGLKERIGHRPTELSGGEQQRVSIARALINSPSLLLADEPTGNLDAATGSGILQLFSELRDGEQGVTILMITHNRDIAAMADTVCHLTEGRLEPGIDAVPEADIPEAEKTMYDVNEENK